jgi:excisionase family DNA binding protein
MVTADERMNASQLARYLGMSKPTVLKGLAEGRIPGRRVYRRWVVSRAAVDRWLAGEPSVVGGEARS